jgi:hypothetical protein
VRFGGGLELPLDANRRRECILQHMEESYTAMCSLCMAAKTFLLADEVCESAIATCMRNVRSKKETYTPTSTGWLTLRAS